MESYSYTYDGAHNQTSKSDAKGTTSYSYDSLNRLEKVSEPNGRTTGYTYDKAGNRLTESVMAGTASVTTTYLYNEQNRLMSTVKQSGSETVTDRYSYDNNGNTVSKTTETVKPADTAAGGFSLEKSGHSTAKNVIYYKYDVWNQLIKTTAGEKTVTNTYNGEGYRVSKTENERTTNYLYEEDKVILETDVEGNETARNVYGINLLTRTAQNDTMNYMYNGHGDVTALLGENGTVQGTYYYDAFGNITEQTGDADNSITYAGYQYDKETDLYYLNARMYDARTARFLQEDTYSGDPNDPLSLNLYTYCENEPVMYWDPTGHFEETDKMILDSTTLGLLEIHGDNWNAYNQKANSYKNKDKDLYDFYIGLRNDQHAKAEEARADYVANYLENDYMQEKVLNYVEAKSGKQAATVVASTYYSYNNDGRTTQAIYQQMHIKPTGIVTANEKLLISAQNSARGGLNDVLDQKNQYGYTYYSMSYGKKYQEEAVSADTNNFVWQKFAFVAGLYIDVNNPAGRVEPEAFAGNAGKIIVDYSSKVVSGMLISDDTEPGGRDFLNIIDPFQHEKKAHKAGIKADYVNATEYKYLIYGNQENSVRKKYIGKVEDFKKTEEKKSYDVGTDKQNRIYKKLILEYINNVINENKNHDATVKKLNNQFKKIFK